MNGADDDVDDLTLRAKARVGALVRDKWRLDALLGVGGMAAVYAATHRNGKRVAMKILHREVALSDDSRARFLREGYVANAVAHKGAVSVIDDDVTEDGAPFFTMDLLDGETFDHRVRRKGRLAIEEVLAATYQLLDVLAAAHAAGIVHRDIKPENVFLTKDATVKVLDFGIAHLHEASAQTGAHPRLNANGNANANANGCGTTQAGHTMGTPSFMPPEQARGRWHEVDARSDLWAVGATMFTMLTGRHVHEADTMNEVLLGAMSVPAKPIALYRPELPRNVCEIVDRALAFGIDQRWQTAEEMRDAVREAYRAVKQSIDDLGREPTLVATSVNSANLPMTPAPVTTRATVTTARPTTHTPLAECIATAPPSPRARIAVVSGGVMAVALAIALMFVRTTGPVPMASAASSGASDPSSNVTTETPSAGPAPAPPSTGALVITAPSDDLAAPPASSPAARPRPRRASPATTPAASPPLAAPAPAAPASDPLTRRH